MVLPGAYGQLKKTTQGCRSDGGSKSGLLVIVLLVDV